MNEETFEILANQKMAIENLSYCVDDNFKQICDWGKRDRKDIQFLSFCFGVMAVVMIRQNTRIKKLEEKINKTQKIDKDPLEKVPME